jgi:prevent-host-death family protein
MSSVNIHEAKTQFSRLLQRVAAGEEITISNRGVPVARLIPVPRKRGRRQLGIESGRMKFSADFDAPLPPEILAGFLGDLPKRRKR